VKISKSYKGITPGVVTIFLESVENFNGWKEKLIKATGNYRIEDFYYFEQNPNPLSERREAEYFINDLTYNYYGLLTERSHFPITGRNGNLIVLGSHRVTGKNVAIKII